MSRSGRADFLRILLVLSLLLPPAVRAQRLTPGERDALLAKMESLRESGGGGMSADFTETRQSRLLQKPIVTTGTMIFQAPGKFRREISGTNASVTVSDGRQLWIYYPNFNEAEHYAMGEHAMFDDSISALTAGLSYTRLTEFYTVEAHRETSGHRLVLTPKRRNLRRMLERMSLWLDDALRPLRTVVELPKGDRLTTEYRDVRRARFPDNAFAFTPPEGATISRPMNR